MNAYDPLIRLSQARTDFVNTRRRAMANPDSLHAFLTPTARGRYREVRLLAMRPVTLPNYTPPSNVVHPIFQTIFRQLGIAA